MQLFWWKTTEFGFNYKKANKCSLRIFIFLRWIVVKIEWKIVYIENLIRFFIFLSYSYSRLKIRENLFIYFRRFIKNFLNTKKENGHNLQCSSF